MLAGLQPWQPTAPVSPAQLSPSSLFLSGSAASSRPPRPAPGSHTAPSRVSLQLPDSAGPEQSLKPERRQSPLFPETPAGCSAPEGADKQKDLKAPNCAFITAFK